MYFHLRLRALQILGQGGADDRASQWCDRFIALLILTNIAAVVLESVDAIGQRHATAFAVFEAVSVAIFTLEYALRVWASGALHGPADGGAWRGRRQYLLSFHGLVDLAATLPAYLQFLVPGLDLRVLRILRLLRVLKFSHYNTAIEDLLSAIRAEARSFYAALYLLLIATLLSASLMYFVEGSHQPEKFASIPDSLYWALITLTTVGYGDVSPVTALGKVISVATAFLGVCTVAMLTGIVASAFSNEVARRKVIFETELRRALADGRLTAKEQRLLQELQDTFELSDEQVQALVARARRRTGHRS